MTRWKDVRQVGGWMGTAVLSGLMLVGCPSSGVGDPCIPEDEYKENFAGFKLTEENIESRSFQCQTRICLVNHFQGRASCPAGQEAPEPCNAGENCPSGQECTNSTILEIECADETGCPSTGAFACIDGRCIERVCAPGGGPADNDGRCWVPGTSIPVSVPVCGQCDQRNVENSVYCSCRCGLAEGEDPDAPENADFNFCECPKGYVCEEIRKNVGLGDKQISGKYCIKENTKWESETKTPCGTVQGYHSAFCEGTPTPGG